MGQDVIDNMAHASFALSWVRGTKVAVTLDRQRVGLRTLGLSCQSVGGHKVGGRVFADGQ